MKCGCASICACFVLASCVDTGQERVSFPLYVSGAAARTFVTDRGAEVELEEAELAFGPLYLCAGTTAGDLCDEARLEWLGTVVVDLLDPEPQLAGDMVGRTGPVRSYMYDYAISSQLTSNEAVVLDAAEAIGEASLRVRGTVTLAGDRVPFEGSFIVSQTSDTELGVPVVRSATSIGFMHDVSPDQSGLLLRFDPAPWIEASRLEALQRDSVCALDIEHACEGAVLTPCDGSEPVRCETTCDPQEGCAERVQVDENATGTVFRAFRNVLQDRGRPAFEWDPILF